MNGNNKMIPRGIRNNNPGNIRISNANWRGKVALEDNTDTVFEQFETIEYGIRALFVLLRTYIVKKELNTVKKIITAYAPANENDTKAYIKSVCKKTGFDENEKLSFNDNVIIPLAGAICFHECGGSYVTHEQIEKAWGVI